MPKTLNLPKWMLKSARSSDKVVRSSPSNFNPRTETSDNNLPVETIPENNILRGWTPYNSVIANCDDSLATSQENFFKIASDSELILNILDCSSDIFFISIEVDLATNYKPFLAAASTIHVCTGVNRCSLFRVDNVKTLPNVFIKVLNHIKCRLVGNNIVNDLLKIENDFNINLNYIIVSSMMTMPPDNLKLSCAKHKYQWIIRTISSEVSLTYSEPKEILTFGGEIIFCQTFGDCAVASENLLCLANSVDNLVLGFDLEWPMRGKVALMQICSSNCKCYLFHLSEFKCLPKVLMILLGHPKIKLSGLNIKNDIRKLGKDFNVDVNSILSNNLIELTTFANHKMNTSERWSLDRLVENLTKKVLLKTPSIRMSNWSKRNLSQEQLSYAASDAYASLLCYNLLCDLSY